MSSTSTCDPEIEIEIPLLKGLTSDDLSRLHSMLRRKTVPANTTLMMVEQAAEIVYIILSGAVKVHIEQPDGSDVILAILGAGDVVGEMSLLDNTDRSASVLTLEETKVLWMGRTPFCQCLRSMPPLAINLACVLSTRLRMANERIQSLVACNLESRVARQILAFADRYGVERNGNLVVPIRLTQSDIANLVGASREYINKIIVSYKSRGYISVDNNHYITIRNRKALTSRCL